MPRFILLGAALLLALAVSTSTALPAEETVPLSTLDLHKMKQGWGEAKIDQSVTGKLLVIGGQTFEHGVGTHAVSVFFVQLNGGTSRFSAKVGVDDSQKGNPGSVEFRVIADGKTLFKSGVMKPGDAAKSVDVDLTAPSPCCCGSAWPAMESISIMPIGPTRSSSLRATSPRPSIRRAKRPSSSRPNLRSSRESTARRSTVAGPDIRSSIAFPQQASGP